MAHVALLAAATGLAIVVAHDGSPPWQLTRLAAVGALTWLARRAMARSAPGRRAAVAFVAGLAAVPLGVGVGLPHLAKSGSSLLTVAGLLGLLGGVTLLAVGGAGLVHGTRRRWRALVVPALLLAVFVAVRAFAPPVAATNVPRTDLGATTPADVGHLYLDVEPVTRDEVTLSGWYLTSTNGAAVVLLHGAGSTRSSVLDHAAVLARHGYGVLLVDARGHGRSGGRAMDFGWYGDLDVEASVSFLEARPEVEPGRIAAVGMSMGGEEALGAAAADPRVRAVVAEGATNRVAEDTAWLSEVYGWRGHTQEALERLVYGTADLLTDASPPRPLREAVAVAAPRPVLLIAAGDVADEAPAGRHIQRGSPGTVELWVAEGAAHTGALDAHPLEWERRVTAFLDRAIGPTTETSSA